MSQLVGVPIEMIQPLGVAGLELVPRDDQYVIPQPALAKVFEHGEGVRPHRGQERIGGPVEKLKRRNVGLEVAVADELADRLVVRHERPRLGLTPEAVGVADAVGAVRFASCSASSRGTTMLMVSALPSVLTGKFGRPVAA
ncbi:MAG TPA: hypothetical protein VFQ44_11290 [Streptosporangiaceae bacterium]|nr:hypothetical protein [Streptosporangiaceae bacterium]